MMLGAAPVKDPVGKAPDLSGPHGTAWRVDLDACRRKLGVRPEDDGQLVGWIVEAPWAHPLWHSYAISLLHLRPLSDGRPTKFYLEGATHEIWVDALDPDGRREPVILGDRFGPETCKLLTPKNFASQFIARDDAEALMRVENAVRRIVYGALSPDTDYIRHWMHLFGDNMVKGDKKRAGETRIITDAAEIVIPPQPGPQDLN